MRRDPKKPRRKLRRGLVRAARSVNAQEHLLRQFFGYSVILNHPVQEMDYRRAVLLQKHTKARSISLLNAEHQLRVKVQSRCGSSHIWLNPLDHPVLRSSKLFRKGVYSPLSDRSISALIASLGGVP